MEIVLFVVYVITGIIALAAIYNNRKLVEFEDRIFAEFKERRELRRYNKSLDVLRKIRDGRN